MVCYKFLDHLHARLGLLIPKSIFTLFSNLSLTFYLKSIGMAIMMMILAVNYISIKVLRAYLLIVLSYTDTVEAVVSQKRACSSGG